MTQLIEQIEVKSHKFHETAFEMLKCGLYMVTGKDTAYNRHVMAWITRISPNPPVLSIAIDKSVNDVELLESSEKLTVHIFSENQKNMEKKLLREIYRPNTTLRTNQVLMRNEKTLNGRCGLIVCSKIDSLETNELKVYLAQVEFSRIDHSQKPLYFNYPE